ncbi:trp-asp repeat containing protein [Fusarium pseudocircinatum]|uniref:Trp-asp repeat containing protein n=1 Tax=Fusarium pseudocircinatum TaxID=56676 RepID=A0A8H5PLI8_9HYPO|nr:trp-asp repeat containing protein [Fusarium pseudocircinatum]
MRSTEEHSEPNNFHPSPSDTNNYIWGRIGQHNIVIVSLLAGVYGTTSAATTASDLVHSLPQIRFGLLVGIGGAIARPNDDQDITLGDVVVGQAHGVTGGVVQYDFGKAKGNGVWERTGSLDRPPAVLLKALANLQASHEIRTSKIPRLLEAMLKANPGMKRPSSNFIYQGSENDRLFPPDYEHREKRETTEPLIHYGVIASGNTLIKDAKLRDGLAQRIGHQCLCVEMEAAGLVDKFPCLVIRGICDYADSHKNDQWQRYAASTAAAFAVELLGYAPWKVKWKALAQNDLVSTLDQLPFVAEALFNSYAEEHSPMCVSETRVQLLAEIDEWVTSSKSKTVFWLNGMAGTGKSTISRTVAQRQLERHCLGANFFFKRGEASRGNMSKPIPTLARQLAMHIPGMANLIKKAIDNDPSLPTKFLVEQFEKLFKEPLKIIAASSLDKTSLVIVIDALDECEGDIHIKRMLSLFAKVGCLDSLKLRVFITSRPELPIQLGFLDISGMYQGLELHSIAQDVMEHDISIFLQHELVIIRQNFNNLVRNDQRLAEQWPGTVKIRQLVSMTQPLFIAAATVVNRLSREREEIVKSFHSFVGVIVTLATPLTINSLSLLLSIPATAIDMRIKVLQSVLDVPKTPEVSVRILHLSFRDYLMDPELQGATDFWVDEKDTHKRLTSRCLFVMDSTLRENMCRLPFPGTSPSEVEGPDLRKFIPPELHYACHYWKYSRDNLSDLVKDSLRFIRTRLSIIEEAPLQVYLSAIVFSPKHSIVRRLFASGVPNWILAWPAVEDEWGPCSLVIGHSAVVKSVKSAIFSPDSKTIASIHVDNTIRILSTKTGQCEHVLAGHSGEIQSVVFSLDSNVLASSSVGGTLRIWNLQTGECDEVLEYPAPTGTAFAFSRDSELLFTASGNQFVRIWKTQTWDSRNGTFMNEPRTGSHVGKLESVVFSEDAANIGVILNTGTVLILNTQSGSFVQAFVFSYPSTKWSIALSRDFAMILTAFSDDNTVRIWDPHTQSINIKDARSWDNSILDVETSPNGRTVVLNTVDGHEVWSLRKNEFECLLVGDSDFMEFSPDFSTLIVANETSITMCNVETGDYTRSFEIKATVEYCLYSEDCKTLVTCHIPAILTPIEIPSASQLVETSFSTAALLMWSHLLLEGCMKGLLGRL